MESLSKIYRINNFIADIKKINSQLIILIINKLISK